jgi:hypothetical protein
MLKITKKQRETTKQKFENFIKRYNLYTLNIFANWLKIEWLKRCHNYYSLQAITLSVLTFLNRVWNELQFLKTILRHEFQKKKILRKNLFGNAGNESLLCIHMPLHSLLQEKQIKLYSWFCEAVGNLNLINFWLNWNFNLFYLYF